MATINQIMKEKYSHTVNPILLKSETLTIDFIEAIQFNNCRNERGGQQIRRANRAARLRWVKATKNERKFLHYVPRF